MTYTAEFNHGFHEGVILGEVRQMLYRVSEDLRETLQSADNVIRILDDFQRRSEVFWREYSQIISQGLVS